VAALSAHKALELMEIGHMALHGCYDDLEGTERYHAKLFRWRAPMPPNRLREIAPRVKAICEAHDVQYLEASWSSALRDVLHELRWVSAPDAVAANVSPALS
jgi:hypothetical protein